MREQKGKSIIAFPETYVVIDTETTGLDFDFSELIEVSAVRFSGGKEADRFSSLIRPNDFDGLPSFITELTGITDAMLAEAPSPAEAVPLFMKFIGSDILVGYNASFDVNFLYDAAEKLGLALKNDFVDALRIARKLYPDMPHHRLQDMVKLFNIPVERCHRALDDVLATNACYAKMKEEALSRSDLDTFIKSFRHQSVDYKSFIAGLVPPEDVDDTNPIYRKVVVFTGALSTMQRKQALALVAGMGGIPADSVTAKTNYLVIGNEDFAASVKNGETTKMKKARALQAKGKDVTILSETSFFSLISGN